MKKQVKKKFCKFCQKEMHRNKTGIYRDYCGYKCYMKKQNENRKIGEFLK